MRTGKKIRIYSEFAIRLILFYATMILLLPIILVVTYLFPIGGNFNNLVFMFWAAIAVLGLTGIGTGVLFIERDHLKRMVKQSYRNEFIYLLLISAFGLLGFAVMYDYLGFNRQYILNFLIVILALMLYLLIMIGRKYFKFNLYK